MFVDSNEVAKNITRYMKRTYNRKVKSVEYDGNCVFNAILQQISRYAHKYSAEQLRKQAAYFLAKHWDLFSVTASARTDECMESYIRNLYSGHSYADLLTLGVIGAMWKLKITLVTPDLEEIRVFHKSDKPDIVLVYNNKQGLKGITVAQLGSVIIGPQLKVKTTLMK